MELFHLLMFRFLLLILGVQPEGVSWQALRTRETIGNNMEDISVETEQTFFLRDEPRTRQVSNNFDIVMINLSIPQKSQHLLVGKSCQKTLGKILRINDCNCVLSFIYERSTRVFKELV